MAFNPNGIFYTSFNPAELNARSFAATVLHLWPDGSWPLFGLTSQTDSRSTSSVQHGYFTKSMSFASLTVDDATGMVAGDTVMVVDSTVGVVPNMVFQVPATRENVRVVSVDSATQVTLARGYGRVAAGAIADNAVLFCVGNSHSQSSDRPTERGMAVTYIPNYTQIVRNAWALSDTARASLAEAGYNNVAANRQDCMKFHSVEIESILFWGQPMAPTGTPPRHTTQGLIDAVYQYAAGNVQAAGATTTFNQLVTMLDPMFQFQSDAGSAKERTIFTDDTGMRVMHEIGKLYGTVQLTQKETTFGMQFTEFKTYKGMLRLIEHPLFNGLAVPSGLAVIVDLPTLGLAYMNERDVKKEEYDSSADSTNNGKDAVGGSLLSEFATEFRSPVTCGIITGLTAGAA